MDRRTQYPNDQIIGDCPQMTLTVGFKWEVWRTKRGHFVAKTTHDAEGNGYQLEAPSFAELRTQIDGLLSQLKTLNAAYGLM